MSPLLLSATTALSLLWLTAFVFRARSELRQEQRKQIILDVILQLRHLFEHLPQHRGAANALLQGDASFKAKLDQLKRTIDDNIHTINLFFNTCDDAILSAKWKHIDACWTTIKSSVTDMTAQESFQHHTALITATIHLIDDLATRARLKNTLVKTGTRGFDLPQLSHIAFDQLLFAIEFMARARGVGTGVASQGHVSTANRVKLGFLHQKIEEAASSALKRLAHLLPQHPLLATQKPLLDESRHAALDFADLLKTELLDSSRIQIAPTSYFDSGTAAISKSLQLFDGLLPVIDEEADRSLHQAQARYKRTWLSAVILVAGLGGLWSAVGPGL